VNFYSRKYLFNCCSSIKSPKKNMLNERDLQRKSLQYRKAPVQVPYEPLDQTAIINAATETGMVITVEEHSVNGGLGEACAGLLLQADTHARFKIVGFPDEHTVTGSQEEIFRHYGIDGPGLAAIARKMVANH
jgi:transketolase C-terminal domain/subunit